MRAFSYERPADVESAVEMVNSDPGAAFLAGGTTQFDLMKDGVWSPTRLVDITQLPLRGITAVSDGDAEVLRVGALTTMEELATHPLVATRLPMIRDSLLAGASVQLRNMATIGGNLLQRTRCRYYRDPSVRMCNRRQPGSGCAAVAGAARMHAVLGADDQCIALHASDLAVALVASDASVGTAGAAGRSRTIPLTEFYVPAVEGAHRENILERSELIVSLDIPMMPHSWRSGYLKVRDRASYEFAAASAAVALSLRDSKIRDVRIGLGGVGTTPWRAIQAEAMLRGAEPTDATFGAAGAAALAGAYLVPGTQFKVPLAIGTLVRQLQVLTRIDAKVMQ